MNCTSAREIFPSLLDARTGATEHLEARAHLASCPDCQREFAALSQTLAALDTLPVPAPSPRLRQNFYAMLEEEKHSAASIRAVARREHRRTLLRWMLMPAFGAALLATGFFAGRQAPATAASTVAGNSGAASAEALVLREEIEALRKQVEKNNVLVGYSILQQQKNPTNERLEEVLAAAQSDAPDDKVLDNLLSALAFDPSTNIRLRALQALYPHAGRELVRSGVLAALPREQHPLVQLELIDFVAATRSREAEPWLERMAQNQAIDLTVREAAKRAVAQLSLSTTNAAPTTNESSVPN